MAFLNSAGAGGAWQPITPKGVAAFAAAPLSRLLAFQFAFALFIGLTFALFLNTAVYPSLQRAIEKLPSSGQIRNGELVWFGTSPMLLSEGRVLAVGIDLDHTGRSRTPSDFFLEFGRHSLRIFSIGGFSEFPYQRGRIMAFSRTELDPWWGAWRAPLLWLACVLTAVGLMMFWSAQAGAYCAAAWLVAYFANRKARPAEAWRLCGAAMMPASLLLWLGLALYASAAISLIAFGLFAAGHVILGWAYVFLSPFGLPRDPAIAPARKNPFTKK
jgi:hypothetical protein